jgi:hypothetical protein
MTMVKRNQLLIYPRRKSIAWYKARTIKQEGGKATVYKQAHGCYGVARYLHDKVWINDN